MPRETLDTLMVPANNGIPNNPSLPALILRAAVPDAAAAPVRTRCQANGWGDTWEWSVFDYHHFHPASHEALICVAGQAELQLGGPDGPAFAIGVGDAVILPAGFGHKRLHSTDRFTVVGAYPRGQENPEILGADTLDSESVLTSIQSTPLPETDPLTGATGIVPDIWRAASCRAS